MNFLDESGNLEGEDDLEILKEAPLRAVAPIPPPNKGKGISIVLAKRKGGSVVASSEKLMAEAQRIRSSKRLARLEGNVSREVKTESLVSVGICRTWRSEWKLPEKTMLLTPDKREEWVEKVLP